MNTVKIGEHAYYTDSIDFEVKVEEVLGNEFLQYIKEINKEADYTTKKINTDLESYECQLDGYTSMINDVLEGLTSLVSEIEDFKRINRDTVLKSIKSVIKEIHNVI